MAKRRSRNTHDDWGWGYFPASKPIRTTEGIKSKNVRGSFGESWWGKRWIQVLESFDIGGRLQRGRSYARSGQVLEIVIETGKVRAKVQGSMPKPYQVTIQLPALSDQEWEKVVEAMGAQAIFAAKLLAGEMPNEIEEAFASAKVSLFPSKGNQLITQCSCPDYSNPCKHIAAVYYLLGEQFDADPFLIFSLRGRSKEQIIAALRARRAVETQATPDEPITEGVKAPSLKDQLGNFWQSGDLSALPVHIGPPEIAGVVLRRLGSSPAGTEPGLRVAYQAMSDWALKKVLGEA